MNFNDIVQAISVIGFPTLACIYVYTSNEKRDREDRIEKKAEKELLIKELADAREMYKLEIKETRDSFTKQMQQFSTKLGEIATSMKDNNVRLDKLEDEVKSLNNNIANTDH